MIKIMEDIELEDKAGKEWLSELLDQEMLEEFLKIKPSAFMRFKNLLDKKNQETYDFGQERMKEKAIACVPDYTIKGSYSTGEIITERDMRMAELGRHIAVKDVLSALGEL